MADAAASILARLKNKAKESGRSNQLCLQLFCQEEFLRRLQHSQYADDLMKIEPIATTKKYAGMSATITARIKNTRTVFCIDVGVGDVIVPCHEKRQIPTQLDDFETPIVSTYSIETTIAEKLDAMLSLMEFSSRMKDYYDILYLSRKFNFGGNILKTAIEQTFKNRNRAFTITHYDQFMTLGNDSAMEKKWTAFLKKINGTSEKFSNTLFGIDIFLREPLSALFNKRPFAKAWNAANGKWD